MEVDGSEGRGEAQPSDAVLCAQPMPGLHCCPIVWCSCSACCRLRAAGVGRCSARCLLILISTPPRDVVSVNKERSEGVWVLCPLGTRRKRTADCPSSAQLSPLSEHEGMQLHLEPSETCALPRSSWWHVGQQKTPYKLRQAVPCCHSAAPEP